MTSPSHPSDSAAQRQAEVLMVAALSKQLGVELAPGPVALPQGGHLQVDGVNEAVGVYVEAFAHQGEVKAGQARKVLSDAFKLAFLARVRDYSRLVLLFSDSQSAGSFLGQRWRAQALREFKIEVRVVELSAEVRERLRHTQDDQFR